MPDVPDVKVFMNDPVEGRDLLFSQLPEIVAEAMSCDVHGEYCRLDPDTEIDLTIFFEAPDVNPEDRGFWMLSQMDVIIEVAAYDFYDRMKNIGERLSSIATQVKQLLETVNDGVEVSITFIPVRQDCWVKV